MKRKLITWISISAIVISASFLAREERAEALFGEDIPFLVQIITQAIQQVQALTQIIGTTRETVSILEEMNRGIKEVLHLADTAHVPLPAQIYEQAKAVSQTADMAESLYGRMSERSPQFAQTHYKSGVEGLFLSEDAFDYATFLDHQGQKIKDAAIVASPSAAARLTAESIGVLIQDLNQTSRLQAKGLEILSTGRIEDAAKESARYDSFIDTHSEIEHDLETANFSSLPSFQDGGGER